MNDPAFLFYSKDFITGVSDLNFEERGQYITLLCLQHQKGHLSKKLIDMNCPNVTQDVLDKFSIDENGLYFNKRLEKESIKRKEHAEKQRDRALKGWQKRKEEESTINSSGSATAYATALPLVNGNGNGNEDLIENSILLNIEDKKEKVKNESLEILKKLSENKKKLLQLAGIKTPIVYETARGNICELATMAYHAFYEDDSFIELSMQKHRKGKDVIMAQIKAFLLQIQLNEEYKQKNSVKELKTHCTNFLNKTITY